MIKIKLYNKDHIYMAPSGTIMTYDVMKTQFPGIDRFTHIIETDRAEEICYAVQLLSATAELYNIDVDLTNEEKIAEIERIRNLPPEKPEVAVDLDQMRIADALEDLVALSMPDIE